MQLVALYNIHSVKDTIKFLYTINDEDDEEEDNIHDDNDDDDDDDDDDGDDQDDHDDDGHNHYHHHVNNECFDFWGAKRSKGHLDIGTLKTKL